MFFNVGGAEILVVAIVALIAIGPEQLPGVLRKVGTFVAQARSITSGLRDEFMSGMDEMNAAADPGSWMGSGSDDDPVVPRGYSGMGDDDDEDDLDDDFDGFEESADEDEAPRGSEDGDVGPAETNDTSTSVNGNGAVAPPGGDAAPTANGSTAGGEVESGGDGARQ